MKKGKIKKIILIIILILIIICCMILFSYFKHKNNLIDNSNKTLAYNYSDFGIPKFIDGQYSDIKVKSSKDALKSLEDIKKELKIKNVNEEFKLISEEKSENITYYRFNQKYKDILVFKQNIIVSVDANNNVLGFSGYYIPDIDIDVNPSLNQKQIEALAKQQLGENTEILTNELYILAGKSSQTLAYVIEGISNSKRVEIIFDANSGKIISENNLLQQVNNYPYTGKGIDNIEYTINLEEYIDPVIFDVKYRFYDTRRNIVISDYRNYGIILGLLISAVPGAQPIVVNIENNEIITDNFTDKLFINDAISAMAHFEIIYDYYLNVLGRNSYDNKGSKIIVNLGLTDGSFTFKDLNNAAWCSATKQMYIGDSHGKSYAASIDVLGHEFTHGVIDNITSFASSPKEEDLNKPFETGALNEGYSDIMGSLIEGKNWSIAENNKIIRDASNPEIYEDPIKKDGKYYYPDLAENQSIEDFLKEKGYEHLSDYDEGGVHVNSNVVSHAAYLMYENKAFESREQMAKVWYNSLFLLSSYANFEDCALAVIKTAKNMNLSDESIDKITKAFNDTNMLEKEEYSVTGSTINEKKVVDNVNIKIYSYDDNKLIENIKSDRNGNYKLKLTSGVYIIKAEKNGYEEFNKTITIKGETKYDILLQKKSDKSFENLCTTNKCYKFTIYFLEEMDDSSIDENFETYLVNADKIMDTKYITNSINDIFGADVVTSDGKSFYVNITGIKVEFAWYYKGTNEKFNWDLPVTKDTEIEMRLFNGLLNNDSIIDFSNMFNY